MVQLRVNVAVDGVWYGPDYPGVDVLEDVAATIAPSLFAGFEAPPVPPVRARVDHPPTRVKVTGEYKTPKAEPEPEPEVEPEVEPAGVEVEPAGVEQDDDRTRAGTATPPTGTVDQVLAWVHGGQPGTGPSEGWQDRATAALDTEQADGKPRKGVIEPLTGALEQDDDRTRAGTATGTDLP